MVWIVFLFLIPYGLLLSRAGPCLIVDFSFFTLLFVSSIVLLPFLPCRSAIPAVVLCSSVNGLLCPNMVIRFTYVILGFLEPLHCLLALMAHLFLLGHLWPISFPWASLAHFLILYSHGLLLTLLGFPGPITISFIFRAHSHGLFPSTPYFLTSLLQACCGPFLLFYTT